MFLNERLDASQFVSFEAIVPLNCDRVQPELGPLRLTLNMDVRRLMLVTREKEEPVRSGLKNSRCHVLMIVPSSCTIQYLAPVAYVRSHLQWVIQLEISLVPQSPSSTAAACSTTFPSRTPPQATPGPS
jgi:hypothetical protein